MTQLQRNLEDPPRAFSSTSSACNECQRLSDTFCRSSSAYVCSLAFHKSDDIRNIPSPRSPNFRHPERAGGIDCVFRCEYPPRVPARAPNCALRYPQIMDYNRRFSSRATRALRKTDASASKISISRYTPRARLFLQRNIIRRHNAAPSPSARARRD